MLQRGSVVAAVAGAAVLLAAGAASGAKDDLTLVTRATGGAPADNDSAYNPVLSADGRYVAFESGADNLSTEDINTHYNVFVRDILTDTTILASRATGAAGAAGDATSNDVSISADGRYVAFSSDADNLSPDDNNTVRNIFVRDLQTNTTTFVSRAPDGGASDAGSLNPTISADGRYVAFASDGDNLSLVDDNLLPNVFVRDLQLNTTTYVGPTKVHPIEIPGPPISPDGRFVAFDSEVDTLSAEDNDAVINVYLRDLQAGTTTYVSRATGGTAGDGDSQTPAMSADGRFVAFQSSAANLSPDDTDAVLDVFVRDLQAGTTSLVSVGTATSSGYPAISADGRYVAYADYGDTTGNVGGVFVRDLQGGTTTLASRASGAVGAPGDDGSGGPAISPDGRFVAFESNADNLSADDNNAYTNIFLRDVLGPPPGPPPPGGDDTEAPRVSGLSMTNRRFRVGNSPTPVFVAGARGRPAPRGTRFRYALSEQASVSISIERAAAGMKLRRKGARKATCLSATRSNRRKLRRQLLSQASIKRLRGRARARALKRATRQRRCTIYKRTGNLSRASQGPGAVQTRFSGRIGTKALKRGRFRATLRATDAAGNRSAVRRIGFTIAG